MTTLKIEIIHDIVCSWCVIGYHHILSALKDLRIEADIQFLPHELNPTMDRAGIKIDDYFVSAHQWDKQKLNQYRRHVIDMAERAGAVIDFSHRTHYFNTHLAHRLIATVTSSNTARPLVASLHRAYHAKGKNISKPDELRQIAYSLGLTDKQINSALDTTQRLKEFEQAKQRREQFVTPSVPAFIINDEHLIVGSQSRSFFRKQLSLIAKHAD